MQDVFFYYETAMRDTRIIMIAGAFGFFFGALIMFGCYEEYTRQIRAEHQYALSNQQTQSDQKWSNHLAWFSCNWLKELSTERLEQELELRKAGTVSVKPCQ